MLELKFDILVPLVGNKVDLGPLDIDPWLITYNTMQADTKYEVVIVTAEQEYMGTAIKLPGDLIQLCFEDQCLAIPAGACATILIPTEDEEEDCEAPTEVCLSDLTEGEIRNLRVAIFDENDCPLMSLTVGQLKDFILKDAVQDACDLFNQDSSGDIPLGTLVAGDSIAVLPNGTCKFKRVSPSDLCCEE